MIQTRFFSSLFLISSLFIFLLLKIWRSLNRILTQRRTKYNNHIFPVCLYVYVCNTYEIIIIRHRQMDWKKYGHHTVFCLFKIYYFCSELECHSKWIDISWFFGCLARLMHVHTGATCKLDELWLVYRRKKVKNRMELCVRINT